MMHCVVHKQIVILEKALTLIKINILKNNDWAFSTKL